MPRASSDRPAAELIAGECLAVRVRTLNRAVTALYDEALRPHGLRVGQLNLLVAVARMGTARPGDLCRILRMDKSTLSRDVEVMRRNGWLEVDDRATSEPARCGSRPRAMPSWRRSSPPGGRPRRGPRRCWAARRPPPSDGPSIACGRRSRRP